VRPLEAETSGGIGSLTTTLVWAKKIARHNQAVKEAPGLASSLQSILYLTIQCQPIPLVRCLAVPVGKIMACSNFSIR
jgi:hypothetical protein